MMIPQESGREFLGNKEEFLENGGPDKRGTEKGSTQPRGKQKVYSHPMEVV